MARLRNLSPALPTLGHGVAWLPNDNDGAETRERGRDRARANLPWRKWYKSSRWAALRWAVLTRDLFTCQLCGWLGTDTSQLVADHRAPHRGDEALFWAEANLWCLCKTCHDGVKQHEERAARGQGMGAARPSWFRPTHVPLTLVCGPPGAGKSTYVEAHAAPADKVVCFDRIAAALFGNGGRQPDLTLGQIGEALWLRNEELGQLMRASARAKWPAAWLIVSEPEAVNRLWWWLTVQPRQIVVLETSAAECKRRIAADAARGDVRSGQAMRFVDEWWRDYSRAECDTRAA